MGDPLWGLESHPGPSIVLLRPALTGGVEEVGHNLVHGLGLGDACGGLKPTKKCGGPRDVVGVKELDADLGSDGPEGELDYGTICLVLFRPLVLVAACSPSSDVSAWRDVRELHQVRSLAWFD